MLKFDLHKLHFKRRNEIPENWPAVELREQLKIVLTQRFSDNSYSLLKHRNFKYLSSRFAFGVGVVSLLSTLAAIVISLLNRNSDNNLPAKEIFALISSPKFSVLIVILCFSGMAVASSFVIRRRLDSEYFDPLRSDGQNIFQTIEMHEKWETFFKWLRNSEAEIGVKEKDGTITLFTPELLKFELLEIFILGETRHRNLLIADARLNMTPMVIDKRNWDAFEKLWDDHQLSKAQTPPIQVDYIEGEVEPDTPIETKVHRSTSIKTLAAGIHNRKCRRFRLMLRNKDKFFPRYIDLKVNRLDLTNRRRPCHDTLLLFAENRELLDIFFAGHNSRLENKDILSSFQNSLNKTLEIKEDKNATRLEELLKLDWRTLEDHIKDVGLISDAELEKYYGKVR